MKMALLAGCLVLAAGCNQHHSKVPADAYPAHFKTLAAWDSCGASGEVCAQLIIFASLEDAIRDIESRYMKKGWSVRRHVDGIGLTNQDGNKCVSLRRFDSKNVLPDPSHGAPTVEQLTTLVASYMTVISAIAGCG